MSDFDVRWRRLVDAAQRDERSFGNPDDTTSPHGRIDGVRAAMIAARARSVHESSGFEVSDLRGLTLAASVFCVCLSALAWSAKSLGFDSSIDEAAHDLARLVSALPQTNFIPPPPRLDPLGWISLAEIEPELAVRPGVELMNLFDDWLAPKQPTEETSR